MHESDSTQAVILTDWAARLESIPRTRDELLFDIGTLAILYEKVIVQEESLTLSSTVADYFGGSDEEFRLFSRFFDSGAMTIIGHAPTDYSDPGLQELAQRNPIQARAQYIQQNSSNGASNFKATDAQWTFYHRMDDAIRQRPLVRQPVKYGKAVAGKFADLFRTALSSPLYERCLLNDFPGIKASTKEAFASFVENPAAVEKECADRGFPARLDRNPIFDRSLAYRATNLFPENEREPMHQLIQSCFAATFCGLQDTTGRYNGWLRELVDSVTPEGNCKIQTIVEPLRVPKLDHQFVTWASDARKSGTAQELRRSAREDTPSEETAKLQTSLWRELCSMAPRGPTRPVHLQLTLMEHGKAIFIGTALGLFPHSIRAWQPVTIDDYIEACLDEAFGLGCAYLFEFAKRQIADAYVRQALQNRFRFRCVDVRPPATRRADSGKGATEKVV